jgi:short-chain Z-isoprenyl diphosphate synthase
MCKEANDEAKRRDVDTATIYAMSEENLNRDEEELDIFYEALSEYFEYILVCDTPFDPSRVGVNFVSTAPGALPDSIWRKANEVGRQFSGNEIQINILLCYTGKQELVEASAKAEGTSARAIENNLLVKDEIDLVIRTGKNPRRECLSGFLIWQCSYSEYYHIEENFPAIEREEFEKAIQHYNSLRKNKGR